MKRARRSRTTGDRPTPRPASRMSAATLTKLPSLAAALIMASCQGSTSTTRQVELVRDSGTALASQEAAPRSESTHEIERLLYGARPGDVVAIPPGVYHGTLRISASGTAERPIVVRPRIPGTVIIDGSSSPADSDLVTVAGDNVVFEGFDVRNARRSGISIWGAHGVVIRANTVTASQRAGVWAGHGRPGEVTGIVVESNTVAWNCLENSSLTWSEGWPRAIAVDLSSDVRISDNRVHSNFGEGIGLRSTSDAVIADNQLHDNFSVNVYLDNTRDITVSGNIIWHTGDTAFFRFGRPAHGIMIGNEFVDHPIPSENIRIQNNTLDGVGRPFYADFEAGGGLRNSVLQPNTVTGQR